MWYFIRIKEPRELNLDCLFPSISIKTPDFANSKSIKTQRHKRQRLWKKCLSIVTSHRSEAFLRLSSLPITCIGLIQTGDDESGKALGILQRWRSIRFAIQLGLEACSFSNTRPVVPVVERAIFAKSQEELRATKSLAKRYLGILYSVNDQRFSLISHAVASQLSFYFFFLKISSVLFHLCRISSLTNPLSQLCLKYGRMIPCFF